MFTNDYGLLRKEINKMAYTFKKEDGFELIPDGKYECQIEKAEFKETPTNRRRKIALTIKIRSDVEQKCQGRLAFDDIWTSKEDGITYDTHKINRILGTQDIAEGTVFDTIQDVVKAMVGACLVCDIRIKHDDYQNKDVNFIHHYETSKEKPQKLGEEAPMASTAVLDDDDVPF